MDGGKGKDEIIFGILVFSIILIFEPCHYVTYSNLNLICPLILNSENGIKCI